MNTKLSFTLLVVAIFVTACGAAIANNSVPMDPAQPADSEIVAPFSAGNAATVERAEAEPRLWSGEVFLSDNNQPDHMQNVQTPAKQNLAHGCFSEDSQPRPQSGCVE